MGRDKWEYNAESFATGEDVLKNLRKRLDIVLLDIILPEFDEIETLKRIKAFDENLPVIMLSAQGSIEVAVDSLKFGAYDYFTKPIDQQSFNLP
ncbi:MAG: response regulator [Ignavibacterium sp.]|uniref:response regulator n=1 Tax=Ignavibacterium sp. TaxID=2651167 RepID=UPI00404B76AC